MGPKIIGGKNRKVALAVATAVLDVNFVDVDCRTILPNGQNQGVADEATVVQFRRHSSQFSTIGPSCFGAHTTLMLQAR